ncbi:polyamine ABC transporter substrate-binding protein [Pengzhenrongella frigida]|uniref:Spermidine/putrescine ABC transporter substrate-binding protein n=1 Tax=Pengzhenrongella frigida TaxID=1259133 RepID=A0A4Q5N6D9_9MICO|nr:spermidine/putrescine ABC transporter substrate-binding protein [Cellulomonas sp. HLT2-17]RYV51801.1 spermidine/putrescine ABC transporter substrate-binding protein [Cellulomonas sp. HLT2-17]
MTRAQDLPADPLIRALVQQARQSQRGSVSRRSVLAGAAGMAGVGALLAACGTGGTPSGSGSGSGGAAGKDVSATDKNVYWANWTLYLDYDEATQSYPSLDGFQEQSGITAHYAEDIDDNDTYFGKVQGQLANGQDIGQDIVTLTDWMAGRMIRLGYTQELDAAKIPNSVNLLESLKTVDFDPGRKHSLTWQSGFGGVVWSKEKVPGGMRSVSDLWNPEYKGRIEVLSEMRDTIGLIMLEQGVDISGTWGDDEFYAALAVLEENIASGQIRQVKGNSYKEDLISGDAVAVIGWSGDVTQINFENDDRWTFALPDAGGTLWSDNLMVPVGATHKANAEALMDYYFDPAVAAQVAAYVNYICPVQGAQEAMADVDPELMEDPLIFPDSATLAKSFVFRSLTPDEETKYNGDFLTAVGA